MLACCETCDDMTMDDGDVISDDWAVAVEDGTPLGCDIEDMYGGDVGVLG